MSKQLFHRKFGRLIEVADLVLWGLGGGVLVLAFFVLGIDHSDASAGKTRIFQTTVTQVLPTDHGDWWLTGNTGAPDGAKLIVLGQSDVNTAGVSTVRVDDWPHVKNGRFSAYVNAYNAGNGKHYRPGVKIPIHVVAVTDYDHKPVHLLPTGLREQIQQFKPIEVTFDHQLIEAYQMDYHRFDAPLHVTPLREAIERAKNAS